jgi:hypothetical protein
VGDKAATVETAIDADDFDEDDDYEEEDEAEDEAGLNSSKPAAAPAR